MVKKGSKVMAVLLSAAMLVTSVPASVTYGAVEEAPEIAAEAAESVEPEEALPEEAAALPGGLTQVSVEDILPYYNVDCGDFDVTTAPVGEEFGQYQSVTEQVYGKDEKTGYSWGIVDNYEAQAPDSNLAGSKTGGVDTNWTWPHENGGWSAASPKTSTNRYTKNQYETRTTFGDTRKLDYSFELKPGTYDVEILCADPWGCSKTPTITLNAGKASEVSFGSVAAGTVVSEEITLGQDENQLDVAFRATGGSNLAINVNYIMISTAGTQNLYKNYVAAAVEDTVRDSFQLPAGSDGCTIEWKSNDAAIAIDGTNAVVTRGTTDKKVTLTATVYNDQYYVTKEIPVTVKKDVSGSESVAISEFNNTEVTITDDYYNNAFDKEVEYLTKLDPERLLAGFRETAAFAAGESYTGVKRYDGWENTRIAGHTLGHYMSAVARGYANPEATAEQKAALLSIIETCSRGLRECQAKTVGSSYCKEGFLFGSTIDDKTKLENQFDRMEGKSSSGGDWVPWYTMHKILQGLVDAARYTGNEDALAAAVDLGLWVYNRVNLWDTALKNRVLGIEYGGMNDALYDLYSLIQNNKEYSKNCAAILRAAEQFDEVNLFKAVANGGKNVLNNRHANTTIPKFVGALKRYEVLGDDAAEYLTYAEKFWEMVVTHHTYITGGNSENEHFGPDDILYGEETTVNNETCNTYNMLKLSRALFKCTGDIKYADYYENTLINAIMSSQNPETGMSMYFQPMATGYQKVFGHETTDFWCCTGSGMENFTKLNDSIYFHMDDVVIVNQYLSSVVNWTQKGVSVEQKSGIQHIDSDTAEFTVKGGDVKLALRIPDWVADLGNSMKVSVNGKEVTNPQYFDFGERESYGAASAQQRYILVSAADGDVVTVQTPMEVVAKNLPDNEDAYAFKYGPVVLSAKLGNDPAKQTEAAHGIMVRRASTSAVDNDKIGIYAADSVQEYMEDINKNMVKTDAKTFRLTGANCSYDFVPHYCQYTDNYGMYWSYYVGERDSASIISDKDSARKNRVTVDSLQAGYGQYEPGLDNTTGNVGSSTEHIRYATAGGYFEYEVIVKQGEPNYLLLTLRREDDGKPLHVSIGGKSIYSSDSLDSKSEEAIQGMLSDNDYGKYYQVQVEIPEDAVAAAKENADGNKVVRVRFEGTKTQDSACLYNWSYCVTGYRTTNALTKLTVNGREMDLNKGSYALDIPAGETSFTVNAVIKDTAGYVAVNGSAIEEETDYKVPVTGLCGKYEVTVYAENFEPVDTYTLLVSADTETLDLSSSIVNYYSFDEDLSDAKTVKKANVPSVIDKTVSYVDGATAATGKALNMDGSYGLLLGDAKELGESYTVSFWMKPNKIGGSADPTFCAGVFDPEYWLNATFDAKIWSYKGGYISTTAANAYKANEWQYVSIVVDGSKDSEYAEGTLYVNGKAVVSKGNVAKGIMTNANAKMYFGVNRWDALYNGALDDMMIFNTALSPMEVNALMKGEIGSDGKVTESYQNRKEVLAAIVDAESYKESDYTAESYQNLKDAVKNAYQAYDSVNATAEELKAAVEAITKAVGALQKAEPKPTVTPSPKPTVTPSPKPTQAPEDKSYLGKTFSVGNLKYKVTKDNAKAREVRVTSMKGSAKTVKIPATVTNSAWKRTFKVTTVKAKAFKGKGITKAEIGKNVTSIGPNAFLNCKKLKTVVIGKSVKTIGKRAFYGCTKLTKVTVKSKVLNTVKTNAFKKISKKAVIKVPKNKKIAYKKKFKGKIAKGVKIK